MREIDFRADAKAKIGADKWSKKTIGERNSLIREERLAWGNANIGRVPAVQTGEGWLSDQTIAFQDKILGKTQAELFRSGELSLGKFYDNSGITYNVQELYAMHSDLFNKLGITP